jgi:Fibronectin type III domain
MSCGLSLHGWPGEDYALTTLLWNSFDMRLLRHLLSPLLASGLSRDNCRDGMTVGSNSGVIQRRLIAVIRRTAVVWGSLWLLSGSLSLAQTTQSVMLAWDTDTDPTVVGYNNLDYGTSSGSLTQTENVGNVSTATVPGLTAGETYYFAVTAYNAAGVNSAYSNEVSFTPFGALQPITVLANQDD